MLPVEVLRRAEQELCNWHGLGTSVMEISHRSKEFIAVAEQAEQDLRDLLKVPSNYKVLFCHGGARAQFAALPLNLLGDRPPPTISTAAIGRTAPSRKRKSIAPRTSST